MKKAILYVLAFIGTLALLSVIYFWFLNRTGATLYGSAPKPMIMGAALPTPSGPVAMQSQSQSQNSPTEGTIRNMIIRNANIALQVNNIDAAVDKITQLADSSGGYVVSSNTSQDSFGNNTASISIRVPAKGLNNALNALKSFATKVLQLSVSGEDITQEFIDLQSQLNNLQTTKDQLNKIMAGATKTADVLSVYKQLSDTQGQIDVLQGKIKYYKESVAFSLINIDLSMNPIIKSDEQKQWQITETFVSSYNALVDSIHNITYGLIAFFVYFLPLILFWGFIALILFWVGKKIWYVFKK